MIIDNKLASSDDTDHGPFNYFRVGGGSRAPREGDEWSVVYKTIHPLGPL